MSEGKTGMFKNNPTMDKPKKQDMRVVFNCDALSLRRKPEKGSRLVYPNIIKKGTEVRVLEIVNSDWVKINVGTVDVFVMSKYLKEI